jgi:uncharacterized RDD family membrane protein YckC
MSGYTSVPPPGAGGPLPWGAPEPGGWVLSGWWRRVGAHVLDGLVICAAALVLLVAITAPLGIGFFADDVGFVEVVVGVLIAAACICVAALLYAPAMMARTDGRTLGRMATGIRVVRVDGRPIDLGFAIVREVLVKWLLFNCVGAVTFGLAPLIDSLWPLWDEQHRALHDFLVRTRVVRV